MNEGYRRCCGMDIHKDTVVVCVLPPVGRDGQRRDRAMVRHLPQWTSLRLQPGWCATVERDGPECEVRSVR